MTEQEREAEIANISYALNHFEGLFNIVSELENATPYMLTMNIFYKYARRRLVELKTEKENVLDSDSAND